MKSRAKRALFLLSLMVFTLVQQVLPAQVWAVDDQCDEKGYITVKNEVPAEMRHRDAAGKVFEVTITKKGERFDEDYRLVALDTLAYGDTSGGVSNFGGSIQLDKVEPEPIANPDTITFIVPGDLWFPTKINSKTVGDNIEIVVELWKSVGGGDGKCTFMRYHLKPDIDLNCWFESVIDKNNPTDRIPAFCFEGLPTEKAVRDSEAEYTWDGFAAVIDYVTDIFNNGGKEEINIENVTCNGNNCKTCNAGNWEEQQRFIKASFDTCIATKRIAGIGVGIGAGAAIVMTGGAGLIILAPAALSTAVGSGLTLNNIMSAVGQCAPIINGKVETKDGEVCTSQLRFTPTADGADIDIGNDDTIDQSNIMKYSKFSLCKQAGEKEAECFACYENDRAIWTAFGCIPTELTGLIKTIIAISLSVSGGIALLMIIIAAYMFSISQGDPKRTNVGKEILTAAIVGLLFTIFSVTILRIIGVELLQIPGFGT